VLESKVARPVVGPRGGLKILSGTTFFFFFFAQTQFYGRRLEAVG
jgi:hypothetical protein